MSRRPILRLLVSRRVRSLQFAVASKPVTYTGSSQLGSALLLVFFAVIGAGAGNLGQLSTCWSMVMFMTCMVLVHWTVLAIVGRGLLKLPMDVLILASNANIGGPATAASEDVFLPFLFLR